MELATAVDLIARGILAYKKSAAWADLGAGDGLFTRALTTLLPKDSIVYSVDTNMTALQSIRSANAYVMVEIMNRNFVNDLPALPPLDGILIANALHYVPRQQDFLRSLKPRLKRDGVLLIIEYDMEKPNQWVPYPLPRRSSEQLLRAAGFHEFQSLQSTKSIFNASEIYSVTSRNS